MKILHHIPDIISEKPHFIKFYLAVIINLRRKFLNMPKFEHFIDRDAKILVFWQHPCHRIKFLLVAIPF
jgi:hypothetical protein